MTSWLNRPKPVLSPILSVVFTLITALMAALATADADHQWWYWAGGALSTVLILVVQHLETRAARIAATTVTEAERTARVSLTLAVNSLFQDIAGNLAELLSQPPERREQARATLLAGCLYAAAAHRLLNCDDARANLYRIQPGGDLVPVLSKGRVPQPTAPFIKGTPSHATAMRMIEDSGSIFCRDVSADAPTGFTPSGHSYGTFISVPVKTKVKDFGMLTIDAPNPGDLQDEHVELARALAQFIAAALAVG